MEKAVENSKTGYQLLQPNGLRTERTGVGFGTCPPVTPLSINLFSGSDLVEGSQAELQPPLPPFVGFAMGGKERAYGRYGSVLLPS